MLVFCKKNVRYFPTELEIEKEYWKRRDERASERARKKEASTKTAAEEGSNDNVDGGGLRLPPVIDPANGSIDGEQPLPIPDEEGVDANQHMDMNALIESIAEFRVSTLANIDIYDEEEVPDPFEKFIQELEEQELVQFFDFPEEQPETGLAMTD